MEPQDFAQKLKRKVNEEEIPRRKKQLSVVFSSAARAVEVEPQVLKEPIAAGRSRNRGRWSDMYLSGGWATSLKMSRSVWVETLQR